jgi:hypothetical protein
MKITAVGFVTSVELKEKEGKITTDLLLAQNGEQTQLKVRLSGDRLKDIKLYSEQTFTGRLMIYKTNNGVGSIMMA